MSELILPVYEWYGLKCKVANPRSDVKIITTDSDIKTTDTLIARALEVLELINNLGLPHYQHRPQFTFRLAVFPTHDFKKILFGSKPIEEQGKWLWAKACCRGQKYDDTVCYDLSIVTPKWNSLATLDPDDFRELGHEITHSVLANELDDDVRSSLLDQAVDVKEALAELVPRIDLGLQKRLPNSTEFLLKLRKEDFIPLATIRREGTRIFSAKPLSENTGYGSIYLAGLTMAKHLGSGNLSEGIRKLYSMIAKAKSAPDLWNKVGSVGFENQETFLQSSFPMIIGQNILREFVK